jgi:hypothetical protein
VKEQNMDDTSQDMRATLLAASDDMPPGIDLLRGVREQAAPRQQERRRRMRALVPVGAIAAVGGVAATATLLATSVTTPPSALAAVTSAVVKTSQQSYRFTLSSTAKVGGRGVSSRAALTGAIDPQRKLGAESFAWRQATKPVTVQIRFIGQDVYTSIPRKFRPGSFGKPWDKAPIPPAWADGVAGSELEGISVERPISPTVLLGVLRSAATVRKVGPASGPGWTGVKYAFTAHVRAQPGEAVSGTVYVDRQGRVRGLATTVTWHLQGGHSGPVVTDTSVLTFGDFGGPVSVTAPPPSQVSNTRTPYLAIIP